MVRDFVLVVFIIGTVFRGAVAAASAEDVDEALARGQNALQEGDTQQAVAHLLDAIRQQQDLIRQLQERTATQRETLEKQEESMAALGQQVTEQRAIIDEQKATIAEYEKQIDQQQFDTKTAVAAVEEVRGIEEMYQQAYQSRRTGIFDVRRRDAEPYFRKAIEQFRYIAETYPESRRAPDAQFQVAKTYHRWLDNTEQAIREYKRVTEKWPDSPFAEEAQEALSELGQPANP